MMPEKYRHVLEVTQHRLQAEQIWKKSQLPVHPTQGSPILLTVCTGPVYPQTWLRHLG